MLRRNAGERIFPSSEENRSSIRLGKLGAMSEKSLGLLAATALSRAEFVDTRRIANNRAYRASGQFTLKYDIVQCSRVAAILPAQKFAGCLQERDSFCPWLQLWPRVLKCSGGDSL